MRRAKPVLPQQLEEGIAWEEAVAMACADDMPLTCYLFAGCEAAGMPLAKTEYKACVFRACRFTGTEFTGAFFQNVIFEQCDFSGLRAMDATLQKCELRGCKLVGANFAGSGVTDTLFEDCAAQDVVFAECLLKEVEFAQCNLAGATFSDLKPRSKFVLEKCNLMRADFLHTSLNGQDLTTCAIEEALFAGPELRGAIVTPVQACELARLLGVKIK